VIRAGFPCRLYFDLEYLHEYNPCTDGNQLLDLFISSVIDFLRKDYDIIVNPTCIVDLDSSTPLKFSHHLIVHMPGALFINNIHGKMLPPLVYC